MTRTSLDLTPFGGFLGALGWVYWLVALLLIALALWLPKALWKKVTVTVVVLTLVIYPVFIWPVQKRRAELEQQAAQYKARYTQAKALFDERCKSAGEKIYKTVDNVEGVLLLGVRTDSRPGDHDDQNWPDAGLPHEYVGTGYLASFLGWEQPYEQFVPEKGERRQGKQRRGAVNFSSSDRPGYRYVDVRGEGEKLTRYTLPAEGNPFVKLAEQPLKVAPARYAVSFVNTADRAERAQWIAGTTVTITDTQTLQVLATSTWYSFEAGFGNRGGARQPWMFAKTCPPIEPGGAPTRFFVDQVLKPKQGN